MLTDRIKLFLFATIALLPVLGLAALLWQRYYHDDPNNTARRVVKNSAIPTLIRLLVRAIDMAFALVLYRLLAPEAVGQFDLAALLVVLYLGTFSDFGLGTLLTREVARRPEESQRLLGVTLLMRWGFSLLALPLAAVIIGLYGGIAAIVPSGRALTRDGALAILILCLTLFPSAYNNVVTAVFNARERLEIPAAVELITQVVSVFARVGVLLAGWGVVGLAWAAVATTALTSLVFLVLQIKLLFAPRLIWDAVFARSLLRPAFPLLLNSLLVNAAFSFDAFILRAFTNDNVVAQYRMPYRVINVALILPPLLINAIFPIIARHAENNREALNRAYHRTLQVLLLAAFPISVATTVLSSDLVSLFAGRSSAGEYLGVSDHALQILIWFLPLSYVNGLTQYVMIALNRQTSITRSFGLMAAFNLLANLVLIGLFPSSGIYVASIVTVLSEVVLFLAYMPLLRREAAAPPLLLLSWRPAVASLLMGAAMLAIDAREPQSPLLALVAAVAAPPIYLAALWMLGAFGAEERALMRRVLGRT
jgi:O-antigen/teichoic acid export membrane protein